MSESKHTRGPEETPIGKALVLRTCAKDMSSYGGFQWPSSGHVEAPDWSPKKACGRGLHGLLWGEGDGSLVSWDKGATWLVVEVEADQIVDLGGKVKFPSGVVVFCGDRKGATEYLAARAPGRAIVGGTATAGYYGTATAGDCGILSLHWWDGKRCRIATFYVGEGGIEPNQPYKVDEEGRPVKVSKAEGRAP